MVSLWGKIADWVLGTKSEAAKVALFRLSHADTLAQQLSSFSELRQYVAPARQDSLTWQISDSDSPVFRIGDFDIPCHAATENTMANLPPFDLDDRCRLLCSMHYDGQNVVSEYHHFAAETLLLPESDGNADPVLAAQERFVSLTPSLLRSLKLIGLDQNDVQGNFARDIHQTVERMVSQMTGDKDTAVRAARNAENLSIFASNIMREVNAPDTSISRSDAAQTHGREPVLIDSPLDAIRAIRLSALNSHEYLSPSAAALELLTNLLKAGQLREANFAYAAFAERYPRNARYVAGIVPAKVLNHYWMGHLDYLGSQRVPTWQAQNPKWADNGVEALLGGTLDTWAEQALAEIRMTAARLPALSV
ncbi:hypothetical protein PHO31112_03260 [Pandoraea horticolens]|uniref:Uncharacterized protein n=1 Tax=Pandoraea horticolens TaxID=2508298 RepID=A0A5E4WHD7_9BURK|nr:hypothetical protein PHO31112_03260 [Pandoraea horticolens]